MARVHPGERTLYQEHDLDAQWRVLDALARHSDVPVPRVVGHDTRPDSALGRPFFVMERIDGAAPPDNPPFTTRGWVMDGTDAQRAAMHRDGVDLLARIHAVDVDAAGLGFLADSRANPAGVDAAWRHDERFLAWVADGRDLPLFADALSWMEGHPPPGEQLALSWGDARLGNLLFSGFRPVAVLDWEMVTLAGREADVGWWTVFDRLHTEGIRRPRPAGFLSEADVITRYETQAAHKLGDIHYYQVRAAYRAGLLLVRHTDRLVREGVVPPDARRTPATPAMNVLTDLLGCEGEDRAVTL